FQPFAAKLGATVLDESWDGGYGVLQAKVKAGVPNWDAVQVEAEELELGCSDGIYEKIDWQKIGGKDGFIPAGVSDCGVGAIVWSTGLAYDGDKIKDAPKSWADFWDTAKYPGKRGLRKGAKYTLEFALMAGLLSEGRAPRVLKTKEGGIELRPGDCLEIRSSGGGGWGPPEKRSAEARARDVAQGRGSKAV
ncbi:extracellular solute-binding protein, partial [Pantoea dispersa]|uniref:extracellular solute-binding protein n=1 Tax=Pantoea dispersa TaxID=59814 RepID=UPI000B259B4E